jgi:hypothetical protein
MGSNAEAAMKVATFMMIMMMVMMMVEASAY